MVETLEMFFDMIMKLMSLNISFGITIGHLTMFGAIVIGVKLLIGILGGNDGGGK